MIVDSSALIAILREEHEAELFAEKIAAETRPAMSIVSLVESAVVADGQKNPVVSRRFDELVKVLGIQMQPATIEQGRLAREAYRDFGKGSGHPARLNFGDCFAYALAKDRAEPLLFKGEAFSATDVIRAL